MKFTQYIGIGLIALLLMGCQTVKPEKRVKPKPVPVQLMNSELSALFVNHTVESYNLKNKVTSLTYYAPDGQAIQQRDQTNRLGSWKIVNNEVCLSMEDKPYSCRPVYKVGKRYYKYKARKNGSMKKIIRYRSFEAGKTF